MTYKLIFPALLCAGLIFSLFLNWTLWQDKKSLTKALDEANEYVDELKRDIEVQAHALADRETKINQLSRERNRLSKQLKEAAAHDEATKAWANEYVPSSVSSLLKQSDKPAANPGDAAPSLP